MTLISDEIEDLAYQIDPEAAEDLIESTWERLRELTKQSGKRCERCHEVRPLFQFGFNTYAEDGLSRECGVCHCDVS